MASKVHSRAFVVIVLFSALISNCVRDVNSIDLKSTGIRTVTNDSRYLALNPNANLAKFNKEVYAKGNIIFTSGERIDGDRLILTFMDETQYTRAEDVEVSLWYPAAGENGYIMSYVQIYADLSSTDAEAFFAKGGVGKTYAEILLATNKTSNYGYQIYLYGY